MTYTWIVVPLLDYAVRDGLVPTSECFTRLLGLEAPAPFIPPKLVHHYSAARGLWNLGMFDSWDAGRVEVER